ncbi:MAG: CDP-alcohol phosphatidyltransferase family protein [Verrucomicrobiota bacterium]
MPASYQPTSRRPIADVFRQTAKHSVNLCLKLGVHPDTVSYGSMVAAAAAAGCFWQAGPHPWLLLIGSVFCYLRLWLNMLDGMVALAAGKASWRGEILNDLPDRVSDVLIFIGVAHSGLCSPFSGYWVAILALLTAYVGMFGQAVGAQREFSGVMAKPWRMVALHLGAWLAYAYRGLIGSLTILDWTCILIAVGCLQTIAVRLHRIMRALREKGGSQ